MTLPTYDEVARALQAHGLNLVDCRGRLAEHPTKKYKLRASEPLGIVFHHSGGSSKSGGMSRVRAVARYAVEDRGWPGVPYDIIIDPEGVLYLTGAFDVVRYHAGYSGRPGDENASFVSCCLLGSFAGPHNADSDEEPTLQQQLSTLGVVLATRSMFPSWVDEERQGLWLHADLGKPSCPGETISRMIRAARAIR